MSTSERWPVIDTHYHTGVCLINTFDAEHELIPWMDKNGVDIQVIFQVNEGFAHRSPDWNPYIGNDYIAKIQRMFPERVIGLCTLDPWHQAPKTYNWPKSKFGRPMDLPIENETLDELERSIMDLGLQGIKLHPLEHNFEINNKALIYPIMEKLTELYEGELIPSRAFAEGGIHEAIMAYEDTMFFEILAQELALRDMDSDAPTPENVDELRERMDTYLGEFEQHGTDNITVDMDE